MGGEMSSILRELELVQDQIGSLARDAHEEKHRLLGRQEELRTQAARLADRIPDDCPTADLLAQLDSLRRQRDALARQNTGGRAVAANRPNGMTRVSRSPRGDGGLLRIDEKISRIQAMLTQRGIRLRDG